MSGCDRGLALALALAMGWVQGCGSGGDPAGPAEPAPEPAAALVAPPAIPLDQEVARVEDDPAVRKAIGAVWDSAVPAAEARLVWDDARRALRKVARRPESCLRQGLEYALQAAPEPGSFDPVARLAIISHALSAHRSADGGWSEALPEEEAHLVGRILTRSVSYRLEPELFGPDTMQGLPDLVFYREGLAHLVAQGEAWTALRKPEDWKRDGRNLNEFWRTNLLGVRARQPFAEFGGVTEATREGVVDYKDDEVADHLRLPLGPFGGDLELLVQLRDLNDADRIAQLVIEVEGPTGKVHVPVVPLPTPKDLRAMAWAGGGPILWLAYRIRVERAVLPLKPATVTFRIRSLQTTGNLQAIARIGVVAQLIARTGSGP